MRSPRLFSAARTMARRFARNRRGSAAVEFAMLGPLFIMLVFALLETAMVFFAGQMLEIGMQDTARLMFTNQSQGSMSQADFKQDLCNRIVVLMSCSNLYLDVKVFSAFSSISASDLADPIDAGGNFTNNFTYPQTNPGDTVVIRAYYLWPLFVTQMGYNIANINRNTSNSKRLLKAVAAFRVEPGAGS